MFSNLNIHHPIHLCRDNAPGALILVHFPRALDALRRQIKNFDHFLTLLTRTSAGDEFIVESIEADNIILAARFFLCSTFESDLRVDENVTKNIE